MAPRPKVKLSILRDIGWAEWDPIGLQELEGGWEGSSAADEYDGYLLQVAGQILDGQSDDDVIKELIWAESEHMGMGIGSTTRTRALKTVSLVHAYIDTLSAD